MDTVVKSLKGQPAKGYLSLAVCRISKKPWKPTNNCAFILGPALSGQLWMQNFKQDSFRIIQNPLPKLRSHSGKLSILYPVKKLGSQFKSMFLHFFFASRKVFTNSVSMWVESAITEHLRFVSSPYILVSLSSFCVLFVRFVDTVVKSLKGQPAEGYLSLAVCRISQKPWKPTDNCAFILGLALSGQLCKSKIYTVFHTRIHENL